MTKDEALDKFGKLYNRLDKIERNYDDLMINLVINDKVEKNVRDHYKKEMITIFEDLRSLWIFITKVKVE